MTTCKLGKLSCIFGKDGLYKWSCNKKEIEQILNRSFILTAPPEDHDPFLTIATKVCKLTGMTVVKNVPPKIKPLPEGTIV